MIADDPAMRDPHVEEIAFEGFVIVLANIHLYHGDAILNEIVAQAKYFSAAMKRKEQGNSQKGGLIQ